jgi:glycosyltransferase involved in cell wall biosynthesis
VLETLRIPPDTAPGVNLVGPLDTGSGLGEAARMLGRALERGGIPFAAIPYSDSPRVRMESSEWPASDVAPYDTNVLCLQPDELSAFAASAGARVFANRTTVGLWFWESTALAPRYRPALRLLDRIWVLSEFVRHALAPETSAPVRVIPVPFDGRPVEPIAREDLGLPPDGFLFLAMIDLISARRKNPHAVIEAFCRAFAPESGPKLVLKTINGRDRKPRVLAELEAAAAGRDDIVITDGYVSERERDAMIAACDCLVSLHRAEGLGLPILEAMWLGKPVIATGYSGNLDFMDDTSSYLVPFRLVPVPESEMIHAAEARWAEPSAEVASSYMLRVVNVPEEAREIGAVARKKVVTRFSLDRAAAAVKSELDAARMHPHSRERARRRRSIVDASLVLARDPTLVGYPGRGPIASLRRSLLRAFWPQLADQRRRDEALLQGLTDVERSVAQLEERLAEIAEGDGVHGTDQLSAKRVGASSASSDPSNS